MDCGQVSEFERFAVESHSRHLIMQITGQALHLTARVREVAAVHSRIASAAMAQLSDTDSLYDAGMTSHASVNLMLALEADFGIEFPDRLLTRTVFMSIGSIASAIEQILG